MLETAVELLAGEEAWVVGGTVRDELLGRDIVDLDIACREPERAARGYADTDGGAPFPSPRRHGGWRVALADGRTVDFTPLRGSIEDDLASRDFTINAIARPLAGGDHVDPFDGRGDLEAKLVRAVDADVFEHDPLRLLRAVRFEDELGFAIDRRTERLVREQARLVTEPAGERILEVLIELSVEGWRRLDDLGLLQPLGGSLELEAARTPSTPAPTGSSSSSRTRSGCCPFPASSGATPSRSSASSPPDGSSPRDLHRFRRADRAVGARRARLPRARPISPSAARVTGGRPGRAAPARRRAGPAARPGDRQSCWS